MTCAPVFICGYPRSGTTLLRALLGQHSQMHFINEPEIIYALRRAGLTTRDHVAMHERSALLERLKTVGLAREHLKRLPRQVIQKFLSEPEALSFRSIYESLLPRPEGSAVWGEKSLNNLFFTREIRSLYPNALIIHLVRDPRATTLSHTRKHEVKPSIATFRLEAETWQRWMHTAQSLEGLLEIRFEDLLADAAKPVAAICQQVGLPFEPNMLNAASRSQDAVMQTASASSHPNIARDIDPTRADTYADLPKTLLQTIEDAAADMMQAYGYAPAPRYLTPLERSRILVANSLSYFPRKRKLRRHFNRRLLVS